MSMTQQIESALNTVVANFLSDPRPIQGLKRLSGGASQEIWAFSVPNRSSVINDYILRRAPGGIASDGSGHTLTLSDEARLIQSVGKHLRAVPKVLHICTPEDGLGDGFIMSFVPGETIARKILRDETYHSARKSLAAHCGAALGAIHSVPLGEVPALTLSNGVDQMARYTEIYRSFETPRPVFELALQVLSENLPPQPDTPVLVHGDFRLGNLMIGEDGLRAVLDWELAHFGDPREDIAWICVNSWRFGQSQNRVGGFGNLQDLLDAYAKAGGAKITHREIDWWEMLGTLKWGVMCMMMYERYRSGGDTSVERAAIGRRVSETEIDLLGLIESGPRHA